MFKFFSAFIHLTLAALLTAGHPNTALAFNIVPGSSATGKQFVPSVSYELNNGKTGVITRQPIAFTSIKRGGTEEFLAELKAEFPESKGWTFLAAPDDLKGSFSVSAYYVFFNGTLGGGFSFDYLPRETDPATGKNTKLHWIQRIVSNHKTGSKHGTAENRIAYRGAGSRKTKPDTPFFDIVSKGAISRALPPHFEYDLGKNDPENDHQWSSEVYLASIAKNDPKTVTIYNGVSWGWENKTITEPEPAVGPLFK